MGLSKYWDYLYNPRSDSWEVVSNQAFSTKEVAEEYLKQNQKSQEDIEKIKEYDKAYSVTCIDSPLLKRRIFKLEKQLQNECNNTEQWRLENKQLKDSQSNLRKEMLTIGLERDQLQQESKSNAEKIKSECDHEWKFYGSPRDGREEFCSKCSKKKDIETYTLKQEIQQLKEELSKIKTLGFHNLPIPQDSTSFASFEKKQVRLREILKDSDKI